MQKVKMKLKISDECMSAITKIEKEFKKNGFECYLVGGSVRDLILGFEVYDFDFATNAHPNAVMRMFNRVVPTGIKHGTVTVLIDHKPYEVTTYRCDGQYFDGRRPQNVCFSDTLEEDVVRRDFTINGLAYDLSTHEVIDYVGGLEDIDKKLIQTIGNPLDRFNEDGLRPYRACRFAAKLNFDIDKATITAISKTLSIAQTVAVERIREEFVKLLQTDKPSIGIEYMRQTGLLDLFLPELNKCYNYDQNKFHKYDVYYHCLYSGDAAPKSDPILRLAALLHDIGKVPTRRLGSDGEHTFYNHEIVGANVVKRFMKRLKFANEEIDRVYNLVSNHMFHYTSDWTDGAVRRFMRKVGVENIENLIELRRADRKGNGSRDGIPIQIKELRKRIEKVIEDENAITVKDLEINGNIIMQEFNLTPGRIIGLLLHELLELVLDSPELNTQEILMQKSYEILPELQKKLEIKAKI